jgi:hypothetical protein
MRPSETLLFCFLFLVSISTAAFIPSSSLNKTARFAMSKEGTTENTPCGGPQPHPFSILPGDPSMVLVTNVDLGDKRLEVMKGKRSCRSVVKLKLEFYHV